MTGESSKWLDFLAAKPAPEARWGSDVLSKPKEQVLQWMAEQVARKGVRACARGVPR